MPSRPVPALSVALSVRNCARFLPLAIESVLDQTFGDFEFLILDDGSRDESVTIAAGYAARDARIRLIARENRGLVASLNELLAEARAPIIARMDADDICAPDRFARQVEFLRDHPGHGVVGGATEDIDEAGRPWPCPAPPFLADHAGIVARLAHGGPGLCHPVVTYRRDIVRGVGGYHAAFTHCEDLDLWLRLASVTKLANILAPLIKYRHSASQISSRHATEQQIGAAVARLAFAERAAGRPDPTATLTRLPPLAALDALFGRAGVSAEVRATVARHILYSRSSLTGAGFALLLDQIAEAPPRDRAFRKQLWRTAARLVAAMLVH